MADTLRLEDKADRVVATLDRPETRNAIDQELVDALHALCARLEDEPRILILTGAGGVFASGADIAQLRDRRAEDARRGINTRVFDRIAALPMPVIAAIDGYALGGGAELAYAADIRIGTPGVRIGNPEPGLGIIAAAGASYRLPRLVGEAHATELLLTGRILSGDEAYAWGLLSSLHEPEDLHQAAEKLADRIAALDPLAVRHTKTTLRAPAVAHPAIDLALQAELFESPEKHRRMTAFLERKSERKAERTSERKTEPKTERKQK
ncbi:enoyl-CoA hydratase/isomerase family protein [Microbacterium sp. ASV49]|uniref:Enoyl-CoA hydratase/isomerase family protein n=1 Tax=Microbacterium candidum TaxID=3041922 RepID=A0ABT7N0G6_9MICO|nr:enoyl-CoA hydratase/isomerase family protein [Microbacterium sp. ASV49]MDL9980177.1 enoyl-CoA hydratase/isomerase family protein [Microbacterium sp. ASV49]